ncbi:MAG: hypothetical protein R3C68_07010 [Myxococcota bacterium]
MSSPKQSFAQINDYCRIQVGKVGVFVAQVKWRNEIAPHVCQAGLGFLREFKPSP